MKFDQAINEGFEKYVSDSSEKVEISKDLLQKISDILEFTSSKLTHDENPELYKILVRSYFKIGELLNQSNTTPEDEDEIAVTGSGSTDAKTTYNVDDAVERLAQKPSRHLGVFGRGLSAAYDANRAVKEREKLNKTAIAVYKKNTDEIRKALTQKSKPNPIS